MVINNAIKDTGVVSKTSGINATAINTQQSNSSSGNARKIINNLGSNKNESNDSNNSNNDENGDYNSNNDSGEYAQDDGKPGAVSTVNSKKNDPKLNVKLGELNSDLDKGPNNNPPRGGPEGYAPHNGLGFNGFPHQGYMGLGNPLYGALSALTAPRGMGGGPPPSMGGGGGGSGAGGGAGSIREPQASRPNQRLKQDTTPEKPERPKVDFGEEVKPKPQINKPNELSQEEKNNHQKYNDSSKFINKYQEKLREEKNQGKEINNKSIPENFKNNLDFAKANDTDLANKMDNLLKAREEVLEKAQELGQDSREFLLGTGENPVSALEPLKKAYDAVNDHLSENYQKKEDSSPIKADDLLDKPGLLRDTRNSNESEIEELPAPRAETSEAKPEPTTDTEARSEKLDKFFASIDDIHDEIPDLNFGDDDIEDIDLDLDLDLDLD
jgi:hypothetical protein